MAPAFHWEASGISLHCFCPKSCFIVLCFVGHKFTARMMIRNMEFNLQYMYPHTDMHQTLKLTVLDKVSYATIAAKMVHLQ